MFDVWRFEFDVSRSLQSLRSLRLFGLFGLLSPFGPLVPLVLFSPLRLFKSRRALCPVLCALSPAPSALHFQKVFKCRKNFNIYIIDFEIIFFFEGYNYSIFYFKVFTSVEKAFNFPFFCVIILN
jgi:hypothetical protein